MKNCKNVGALIIYGLFFVLMVLATENALAVTISDEAFAIAMKSKEPVCVKSGREIFKLNDTYSDMGLKYKDCSEVEAVKVAHKKMGFTVRVIKFEELSPKTRKLIMKEMED